jgi:hypothetical protein
VALVYKGDTRAGYEPERSLRHWQENAVWSGRLV